MSREPQTLVWLPTLHRLIATETSMLNLKFILSIKGYFQFDMKLNVTLVKLILLLACGKKE